MLIRKKIWWSTSNMRDTTDNFDLVLSKDISLLSEMLILFLNTFQVLLAVITVEVDHITTTQTTAVLSVNPARRIWSTTIPRRRWVQMVVRQAITVLHEYCQICATTAADTATSPTWRNNQWWRWSPTAAAVVIKHRRQRRRRKSIIQPLPPMERWLLPTAVATWTTSINV